MRQGKSVVVVLTWIALCAPSLAFAAQADISRHKLCPRSGSEVIASNKLVRIYTYPRTRVRYLLPRRTEACLVSSGARMTLFQPEVPRRFLTTFQVLALSGTAIAYAAGDFGVDSGGTDVFVANIATRRVLSELPGEGFVDAGFAGGTYRTDFVLSRAGSSAWIDEEVGPVSNRTKTFIVHSAPAGEGTAVLDEGPSIAPHSLELRAGALSWQDAGVTRTARLTP